MLVTQPKLKEWLDLYFFLFFFEPLSKDLGCPKILLPYRPMQLYSINNFAETYSKFLPGGLVWFIYFEFFFFEELYFEVVMMFFPGS